ncbi:uncharacterized protein EDB91DRAFT_1085762 [Suillus paluster]|uniref:uncharacterized protein n=1 Tax=Suillus paluster TaxID=48578 RepID=UPI001B872124|nr:uncharacterized protein EDB91DRAFT_1085762 [Suillus paluster]KAG1729316.1 hypothetical protein EDB91DRAFT_1085762 [Suillus paluster]
MTPIILLVKIQKLLWSSEQKVWLQEQLEMFVLNQGECWLEHYWAIEFDERWPLRKRLWLRLRLQAELTDEQEHLLGCLLPLFSAVFQQPAVQMWWNQVLVVTVVPPGSQGWDKHRYLKSFNCIVCNTKIKIELDTNIIQPFKMAHPRIHNTEEEHHKEEICLKNQLRYKKKKESAYQNTISSRIKLLVNNCVDIYLDSMCSQLKCGDILPEDIRAALNALEDLRTDACAVEDDVLQQEGVGGALEEACQASKSVHQVVSAVEEIFLLSFDISNLTKAYTQRDLLFQRSTT